MLEERTQAVSILTPSLGSVTKAKDHAQNSKVITNLEARYFSQLFAVNDKLSGEGWSEAMKLYRSDWLIVADEVWWALFEGGNEEDFMLLSFVICFSFHTAAPKALTVLTILIRVIFAVWR